MEMESDLFRKVLEHPEVEIGRSSGTERLLAVIPQLLQDELILPVSLSSLMRAQHTLITKLMQNASDEDQERYAPTLAQLAWWHEPKRFLEATNRTVAEYLDWAYVPDDHLLRSGDECDETIHDLYVAHPYIIIAPLLRTVRNTRH